MDMCYVRKDWHSREPVRQEHPGQCIVCRAIYGLDSRSGEKIHRGVDCPVCGTRQCYHGAHYRCDVCYQDLDPHGTCTYKGCGKPAVTNHAARKGSVCLDHFKHIYGENYISERLAERNKTFMAIDVDQWR